MGRLGLATLLAILMWSHIVAADETVSSPAETMSYDIAAHDLDAAIKTYIRISGVQVFFETAVTAGKRSAALSGRFTAAQALGALLSGTGLRASRIDADAFVIAPDQGRGHLASRTTVLPDPRFLAARSRNIEVPRCLEEKPSMSVNCCTSFPGPISGFASRVGEHRGVPD